MSTTIGLDPDRRTDAAEFELGERGSLPAKEYIYCRAQGAITVSHVAVLEANWRANMVDGADDIIGQAAGVATTAFADDEYGWLQVYGLAEVRSDDAVAAESRGGLDGTVPGQLAASATNMLGIIVVDAISANGVGTVQLTYPTISAA